MNDRATEAGPRRRTVALGLAWTVPTLAVSAPAAAVAASGVGCQISEGVRLADNVEMPVRAVCSDQAGLPQAETLVEGYAVGLLPPYLEICSCVDYETWFRWREVDNLADFQVEVEGVHDDERLAGRGWREPVLLPGFGEKGSCRRFKLSYRTSAPRLLVTADTVELTFVLERKLSALDLWEQVVVLTRQGTVRRAEDPAMQRVDFEACADPSAEPERPGRSVD